MSLRWAIGACVLAVSGCTVNERPELPDIGRPDARPVEALPLPDAAVDAVDAEVRVEPLPEAIIAGRGAIGESCREALDCAEGAFCRWGECVGGCQVHDDCTPGRCDAHGRCVAGPDGRRPPAAPEFDGQLAVSSAWLRLDAGARHGLRLSTTSLHPLDARVVIEGGGDLWLSPAGRPDIRLRSLAVLIDADLPTIVDVVSAAVARADSPGSGGGARRPSKAMIRVISDLGEVSVPVHRQPTIDGRYAGVLTLDNPVPLTPLPIALQIEDPLGSGKPRGHLIARGTPWLGEDRPLCDPRDAGADCGLAPPPMEMDPDGGPAYRYRFVVRDRFDSTLLGSLSSWWLLIDISPSAPPGRLSGRFRLGFDALPEHLGWAGTVDLHVAGLVRERPRPLQAAPAPPIPPAIRALEESCPAELALGGSETYVEPWLEGATAARCLAGAPCPMPRAWVPDGPAEQDDVWDRLSAQFELSENSLASRCCVRAEPRSAGDPGLRCTPTCRLPPTGAERVETEATARACLDEIGDDGLYRSPGPRARPVGCLDLARSRCARRLLQTAAMRQAEAPEDESLAADLLAEALELWSEEWAFARLLAGATLDDALFGASDREAAREVLDDVWREWLRSVRAQELTRGSSSSPVAARSAAAAAVYRIALEEVSSSALERAAAPGRHPDLADQLLLGAITARIVSEACPAVAAGACREAHESLDTYALLLQSMARRVMTARALPPTECDPRRLGREQAWTVRTGDAQVERLRALGHDRCTPAPDHPGSPESTDAAEDVAQAALSEWTAVYCGALGEACLRGDGRVGRLADDLNSATQAVEALDRGLHRAVLALRVAERRLDTTVSHQRDAVEALNPGPSDASLSRLLEAASAAASAALTPIECGGRPCTHSEWAAARAESTSRRWSIRSSFGPEPTARRTSGEPLASEVLVSPPSRRPSLERMSQLAGAWMAIEDVEQTPRAILPVELASQWQALSDAVDATLRIRPTLADWLPSGEVVRAALADVLTTFDEVRRLDRLLEAADARRRVLEVRLVDAVADVETYAAGAGAAHVGQPTADVFAPPLARGAQAIADARLAELKQTVCASATRLAFEVGAGDSLADRLAQAGGPDELADVVDTCVRPIADAALAGPRPPGGTSIRVDLGCRALGICQPTISEPQGPSWTAAERLRDALRSNIQIAPGGARSIVLEFELPAPPGFDRCRLGISGLALEVGRRDMGSVSTWPRSALLTGTGLLDHTACGDETGIMFGPTVQRPVPVMGEEEMPPNEAQPDREDVAPLIFANALWRLTLPLDSEDEVDAVVAGLLDLVLYLEIRESTSIDPPELAGLCAAPGAPICE